VSIALDVREFQRRARAYVEMEAETSVTRLRFAQRFTLFGQEDVVLSVSTTDHEEPSWWVIGGSTPMNLYSKKRFRLADEAFTFHSGLMLRLADKDFARNNSQPDRVGYDAFISHASEDKDSIVRPLARALTDLGFRIWFDEFELKVGDSLRQSIDKGLVNSRFGIVVLSKPFFEKNWPQYELNGLAAKEIDGHKVVLPIWHGIGRSEVMAYSPALADKVALNSRITDVLGIANELAIVMSED
jgi:hypothetical protein